MKLSHYFYNNTTRFYNILLRAISIVARFVFVLTLAKYLSIEDYGMYGLIAAIIIYSVVFLGFEFYHFSQRELIESGSERYDETLNKQYHFHFISYVLFLPLLSLLFLLDFLPIEILCFFYLIVIGEQISQELGRTLIILNYQTYSSLVMLIRTSIWVLILVPCLIYSEDFRSIEMVLIFWAVFCYLSIFYGVFSLYKLQGIRFAFWKEKLDFTWINRGVFVSFFYLTSTMCIRGFFTLDRYFISVLGDMAMLGVYTFYISLTMTVVNFMNPAVFSFVYPKMLRSIASKDIESFFRNYKELTINTIAASIILFTCVYFITPYIIVFIDKPILTENYNIFGMLILMGFIYNCSMIPHYFLYSIKKDKLLMCIHILCFAFFILYCWSVSAMITDIIFGLTISMLLSLFLKLVANFHFKNTPHKQISTISL